MSKLTAQERTIIKFLSGVLIVGAGVGLYRNYFSRDDQLILAADRHIESLTNAIDSVKSSGIDLSGSMGDTTLLLVNINTASMRELESLPKIGPVTAERIIRYRADFGNFTDLDQLKNVKGIGPKTMDQLRSLITLRD